METKLKTYVAHVFVERRESYTVEAETPEAAAALALGGNGSLRDAGPTDGVSEFVLVDLLKPEGERKDLYDYEDGSSKWVNTRDRAIQSRWGGAAARIFLSNVGANADEVYDALMAVEGDSDEDFNKVLDAYGALLWEPFCGWNTVDVVDKIQETAEQLQRVADEG